MPRPLKHRRCLCSKLQIGEYSGITEEEASILRTTLGAAPELFGLAAGRGPLEFAQTPPLSIEGDRGRLEDVDEQPQAPEAVDIRKLERTYPRLGFDPNSPIGTDITTTLGSSTDSRDVVVRLFVETNESDVWKRLRSFVLAQLHVRGASTEYMVTRVHNAIRGDVVAIRRRLSKMLWHGRQWISVVEALQRVCRQLGLADAPLPSVICILGHPSSWERADAQVRRAALHNLCTRTDFHTSAVNLAPRVDGVLARFQYQNAFVNCSASGVGGAGHRAVRQYTAAAAGGDLLLHSPTAAAISAVAHAFPAVTAEAALFLTLLAFLAAPGSALSMTLLERAFSAKKLEEALQGLDGGATAAAELAGGLPPFSTQDSVTSAAFSELVAAGAVSTDPGNNEIAVDGPAGRRLLEALARNDETSTHWKLQALLFACRAVPFKYLEPAATPDLRQSLEPQLQYTLEAVRASPGGFNRLSKPVRMGIALCLAEASRFPRMAWKRSAVAWAREVMGADDDLYVRSNVAQRGVVIQRLEGSVGEASNAIASLLSQCVVAPVRQADAQKALHASVGHAVIESALNHFQEEQLARALVVLDSWTPQSQPPCLAETAVQFRSNLLRAKILRYQGLFAASLKCLDSCQEIAARHHPVPLSLDDELAALTCERADVLCELEEPGEAENVVRTSLSRPEHHHSASDAQLLSICLAESLFAQGRTAEAESVLCPDQAAVSLPANKMVRLRFCIAMAKVRHSQSQWADALSWWTQALQAINRFPPTSGYATRIIHLSIADVLGRQGVVDVLDQTLASLRELESLLDRSEAKFWIAGLRSWQMHLAEEAPGAK